MTSRDLRKGVVATVLTVFAALALAIQSLAVPAAAAVNNAITVDNLTLTKINYQGTEQPGKPLVVSDLALLRFTWDASNANLKDGDQFTIKLPEEVAFKVPTTKDFLHDFDGDGVAETKVGECTIEARTLTCTFNSELPERIKGGYKNVHGTGSVQVAAVKVTTTSEITVSINAEKEVQVILPNGEPIIPPGPPAPYSPIPFDKWAWGMTESDTGPMWNILFSTGLPTSGSTDRYLASFYDADYFNGTDVREIVIKDVLGPGQTFPELDQFRLIMRGSKNSDLRHHTIALGSSSVSSTFPGFSVASVVIDSTTAEGTMATITLRGPFAPDTNYQLQYRAKADPATPDRKAIPGTIYKNTASVYGTDLVRTSEQFFKESFTIDVTLAVGFGTFDVTKYVQGSGQDQVPADASFTVKVDYTLPLTADKYPGWTPPGTLSGDNKSGTVTFEVVRGVTKPFPGAAANPDAPFPAGTVVTVSEVLDSSTGAPAGYAWDTPSFTVGTSTGETVTLTIADGQVIPVELRNTTQAQSNYFQVVKKATGANEAATKDYTFTYTCSDGQKGTITAKGDGVAVKSDKAFPVGTTCTVTEDTAKAGIAGYTLDASGAQTVTIGLAGAETVTASFTNAYSPVPTPTPSVTTPNKPPLARTGASNVVLLGIVGVVLVVAGGGLAVLVKRRRDDA